MKMDLGTPRQKNKSTWLMNRSIRGPLFTFRDNCLLAFFKLERVMDNVDGVETLMSILQHDSSNLQLVLTADPGCEMVMKVKSRELSPCFTIGKVPASFEAVFMKHWEQLDRHVGVECVQVALSTVRNEINRERLMDIVDTGCLDRMTQDEYDRMMALMDESLGTEVYVVGIELRISPGPGCQSVLELTVGTNE